MKTTITTIAAGLLAAFLILSPAFASAATTYTLTVQTTNTSYTAGQSVTVTGTVTPAPGAGTEVGIQVSNPLSTLVSTAAATVNGATGAYSWSFTSGSSSSWPTGTYTVKATWALTATSTVYTASGTFGFTGTTTTTGGSTPALPTIVVHVGTPALVWPGQVVQIGFQTVFGNNGSLAPAKSVTANLIDPTGAATAITSWSNPSTGWYWTTWTVPSSATSGTYFVTVWVNDSKVVGAGLGSMEYNSGIATSGAQAAAQSSLSSITSSLSSITSAISGLSSSLSSMGSSLSTMGQSISTLQTTAGNIQTALGTVSSSITSLQSGITSLQNTLNTVQGNTQNLGGLSNQIGSVNSSISNNQTYLLVVAALVVITLVLELAILVRKLS
jgi:prefoldin subunit 5